ncbi:starch branching enzyme, putative [Trichomonas vaginalis G3]|uniref:1,4-alpha-glucan branching enzyme n=1 Tax=Trichomonas vaginalis (strain ATCC PRA-98 / G3) TaxID=412133 RepID=A2ES64_TRIV3|nr:GlgB family [Trichomonas vaginalis G3]EAY04501.1 starch branching enzyme, putative [Trichomonas vaginalis G3]KAI5503274.1 GlgB family [Trichomonas vaginalis G3]|eukprot:XP_001316724.1 starch branching enzyme [Trichomonas vaginalis G3]
MQILVDNPWLEPYNNKIQERMNDYLNAKAFISQNEGSLEKFSQAYKEYGIHKVDGGIIYKEWAPNAVEIHLVGDFNDWNVDDPYTKCVKEDVYGHFKLFIPDYEGRPVIMHDSKVKCVLKLNNGETVWRIPAWIQYTRQNEHDVEYNGVFWNPPHKYVFKNPKPGPLDDALLIYEAHIGMAGPEHRVHTYKEFEKNVLPVVKKNGYNAIQLMGIMEHPYYGSYGYQVTNFFAVSSRFGTPDDLKSLIDTAHWMGICVFLDLVHSHASRNVSEGLNYFDGSEHQYFHPGERGNHPFWDSRCFDYGSYEVRRFLLSNVRFYLEEYNFDGFRFDGVTSILYVDHGKKFDYSSINEYFDDNVDRDAITYLMLANDIIHSYDRNAITIAEDVSGMIGIARSIKDGGIGFDYRLSMGVPDLWIKMLKDQWDEEWDMENLAKELLNRPYKEKTIAYCESHDQALVGDKTIAFWLMDAEMYTNMSCLKPETVCIARGIALHKLIRFITFTLGGQGYLNFMGNEFGHPEWIDFPREGNNYSYQHCIRQFDLPVTDHLRYKYLLRFDNAMLSLEQREHFLSSDNINLILSDNESKVIAFERGNLLFVFNFHSTFSYSDFEVGVSQPGDYKCILSSDDDWFGGHNCIDKNVTHTSFMGPWQGCPHKIPLYIPCRTASVYKKF